MHTKQVPDLLCNLGVEFIINIGDAVDRSPVTDGPVAGLDVLGIVTGSRNRVHQRQDVIGISTPGILDILVPLSVSGTKLGERSFRIFIKDVDVGNRHAKIDGNETLDEGHTDISLVGPGSALQAICRDRVRTSAPAHARDISITTNKREEIELVDGNLDEGKLALLVAGVADDGHRAAFEILVMQGK